jgi:dihydropteroate synthase
VGWQPEQAGRPAGTWLVVTVTDAEAAGAAVRAGADLLDVGPAGPAAIGAIAARHPGVPLGRPWPPAALGGQPSRHRTPEAPLICAGVRAATEALEAGVPREAILVAARPAEAQGIMAAGWAVLADVDDEITPQQRNGTVAPGSAAEGAPAGAGAGDADEVNAAVAAAAVCAWLEVAAVRTRHVRAVRRALDMTASIRGQRPPAWAVRGLA